MNKTTNREAKERAARLEKFYRNVGRWSRSHPNCWAVIGTPKTVFIPLGSRDALQQAIAASHKEGVVPYVRLVPAASDLRYGEIV